MEKIHDIYDSIAKRCLTLSSRETLFHSCISDYERILSEKRSDFAGIVHPISKIRDEFAAKICYKMIVRY